MFLSIISVDSVGHLALNERMLAPKSQRPTPRTSIKEISVETSYAGSISEF
jgi:hypothetical protein